MASKVFGETVSTVTSRPGQGQIPHLLRDVYAWLQKHAFGLEGLFRVSAGVRDIDSLKQQFDSVHILTKSEGTSVQLDNYDPHLVAGILKAYFIELPEPLLTFELYDQFLDSSDSRAKLKQTFHKLPDANKYTAGSLFLFLNKLAKNSAENKMNATNLAIVFGQILLRPRVETLETLLKNNISKITSVLKTLVENFNEIIPTSKEEAKMYEEFISGSNIIIEDLDSSLTPEQLKLKNLKNMGNSAINTILQKLDHLTQDITSTSSLDDTIQIAKRVQTAKNIILLLEEQQ